MAPFEDITGQVVITGSGHLIRWLYQITAEHASKSLRRLITLTEFTHSWGQNTIVRTYFMRSIGVIIPLCQIVRINGSSTDDDSVVIIAAHQDR